MTIALVMGYGIAAGIYAQAYATWRWGFWSGALFMLVMALA